MGMGLPLILPLGGFYLSKRTSTFFWVIFAATTMTKWRFFPVSEPFQNSFHLGETMIPYSSKSIMVMKMFDRTIGVVMEIPWRNSFNPIVMNWLTGYQICPIP
jgi:hypothetical protein